MATPAASLSAAVPSHRPSSHNAAPPAQGSPGLDDLFNYDADSDTPAQQPTTTQPSTRATAAAANDSTGLGIDEEIKVRKARKPIPKLDEDRLLSDAGIPKLRRISKERLRFRGKSHEFTDVARLLSTYQLWLDDLYPRAKFADGLAMVEKLGHKRRLQVMRKAWIDEEKPKNESYGLDDADIDFVVRDPRADALKDEAGGEFVPQPERPEGQVDHVPEDSDHDELYRRPTPNPTVSAEDGGEPSEDELDALLAEDAAREAQQIQRAAPIQIDERDDFADEEEAMADMW